MATGMRWPVVLVAAGAILIGLAGYVVAGAFQGFAVEFTGPGQSRIDIPQPGDYRLWLYTRTYLDGTFREFPPRLPDGTRVVAQGPGGDGIHKLRGTTLGMSVTAGQVERVALGHFTFPAPGRYTLRIQGLESPRAFALREVRFLEHARRAALFMLPGMILFVSGIVILITLAASPTPKSRR
jgi:hypothetical protein